MYSLTDFLKHVQDIAAANPVYVNGGLTRSKLDCVGLPMLAMKELGRKSYDMHSSNYFYRYQVDDLVQITGEEDVYLGMLLFKTRSDEETGYDLSTTYITGRYNTGDYLDAYHVGIVTGVHPLEITECTSTGLASGIKITSKLGSPSRGGWDCGGKLKGIDYEDYDGEGDTVMELTGKTCIVTGGALNLRESKNTASIRICLIPEGTNVYCYEDDGTWSRIKYDVSGKTYTGYVKSEFLSESIDGATTNEDSSSAESGVTLKLTMAEAEMLKAVLSRL